LRICDRDVVKCEVPSLSTSNFIVLLFLFFQWRLSTLLIVNSMNCFASMIHWFQSKISIDLWNKILNSIKLYPIFCSLVNLKSSILFQTFNSTNSLTICCVVLLNAVCFSLSKPILIETLTPCEYSWRHWF
jgi:hypothetical protein